jgi:hypothetical protein
MASLIVVGQPQVCKRCYPRMPTRVRSLRWLYQHKTLESPEISITGLPRDFSGGLLDPRTMCSVGTKRTGRPKVIPDSGCSPEGGSGTAVRGAGVRHNTRNPRGKTVATSAGNCSARDTGLKSGTGQANLLSVTAQGSLECGSRRCHADWKHLGVHRRSGL